MMGNVFNRNFRVWSFSFFVISFLFLSGCEIDDLFGPKINPLLNSDCTVSPDKFDSGWQKYSDFDYRIESATRSYDARKFHEAQVKIVKLGSEVVILKRDYEITKEEIKASQQYQKALKAGHKANLIKATVRMAYITYKVALSAKGTGELGSKILTSSLDSGIKVIGSAIKVGRDLVPPDSGIALDTSTIEGKIADVEATGWVEVMANFGDPAAVVTEVMKKTQGHIVPSAKLTTEELNILQKENRKLKSIDKEMAITIAKNLNRLDTYRKKEAEINRLESSLWEYEQNEKDRVKNMLMNECKGNQKEWWKNLLSDSK